MYALKKLLVSYDRESQTNQLHKDRLGWKVPPKNDIICTNFTIYNVPLPVTARVIADPRNFHPPGRNTHLYLPPLTASLENRLDQSKPRKTYFPHCGSPSLPLDGLTLTTLCGQTQVVKKTAISGWWSSCTTKFVTKGGCSGPRTKFVMEGGCWGIRQCGDPVTTPPTLYADCRQCLGLVVMGTRPL